MLSDLYEKVLLSQDIVIELMQQKIELQKHLDSIDESIVPGDVKPKLNDLKNFNI